MSNKLILTYVTSNDGKFAEAQTVLPGLQRLKIELPEVQTLDHKELIEAKLDAAKTMVPDAGERIILVEDGANYFDGFGRHHGLPGTLIKHFTQELGTEGLEKIARAFDVKTGRIVLKVGMLLGGLDQHFFDGVVSGRIVPMRTPSKFHFDPIFQPDEGDGRTFSEMTPAEKSQISHRGKALRLVREFLETRCQWHFPTV